MARLGEFPHTVKVEAFNKQGGKCAFCGVTLMPPRDGTPLKGRFFGEAHHLKPLVHDGPATVDNCVYLCYAHHKLLGHGMAPYGIDNQGGSSRTWVQLDRKDFPFWKSP